MVVELRGAASEGGIAARSVLKALLGRERIRAVPVREGREIRWHMTAMVGSGWLWQERQQSPSGWAGNY